MSTLPSIAPSSVFNRQQHVDTDAQPVCFCQLQGKSCISMLRLLTAGLCGQCRARPGSCAPSSSSTPQQQDQQWDPATSGVTHAIGMGCGKRENLRKVWQQQQQHSSGADNQARKAKQQRMPKVSNECEVRRLPGSVPMHPALQLQLPYLGRCTSVKMTRLPATHHSTPEACRDCTDCAASAFTSLNLCNTHFHSGCCCLLVCCRCMSASCPLLMKT